MASAAIAAVNVFLKPRAPVAIRRLPEWQRLIVRCDELLLHVVAGASEANVERLNTHLRIMACSCSKKVASRRQDAVRELKEIHHGH